MSAREDYPRLSIIGSLGYLNGRLRYEPEAAKALREIDALRGDVAKLLAMLAQAGVEWPS